jgi:hypothetical protein
MKWFVIHKVELKYPLESRDLYAIFVSCPETKYARDSILYDTQEQEPI